MKTNKKALFFIDCWGSGNTTPEEEVEEVVQSLKDRDVILNNYKMTNTPPFNNHGESFDILFFDWGGMSVGNSMLDSFSRYLVQDAIDNPSKIYVLISTFTKDAVKDAISDIGEEKPFNIFYTIEDFIKFIKIHGL